MTDEATTRYTMTAMVDEQAYDVEIEMIGDVHLLHWHHDSADLLPDAFTRIRAEALEAGWLVIGEPMETEVPEVCRWATDNGRKTLRHFLVPSTERQP